MTNKNTVGVNLDKDNRKISLKEFPENETYLTSYSLIKLYGCNPTQLALFITERLNELNKGLVLNSKIPSIKHVYDKYAGAFEAIRILSLEWSEDKTELTFITIDYPNTKWMYFKCLYWELTCSGIAKLTRTNSIFHFTTSTDLEDQKVIYSDDYILMNEYSKMIKLLTLKFKEIEYDSNITNEETF